MSERMMIWGYPRRLEVTFETWDEPVESEQEDALQDFLDHPERLSEAIPAVLEYLEKLKKENEELDVPETLRKVEISKANLEKLAVPREIYIPQKGQGFQAALMCDTPLDPEEGLAVVFADGKPIKVVSPEEII